MTGSILLTGATGLLGRYLMRDLLMADIPLAVVVRRARRVAAAERVDAIMGTWEHELERELPRPRVIEGDLTAPALGLTQDDVRWVTDHCDSVLHNAASLTFHSVDTDGEPRRSNVLGTQNVLDLCEATEIRDFHHVSTAYVCGLRSGTVLETELDVGQEFGNDYERSKVEAENLVRSAAFLSPPTIYRPSIIVGDSRTGFTSTFHGFYALVRLAHTLMQSPDALQECGKYHVTRLTLDGNERKNFVPVDWVSSVISHIVLHREFHGQTFHVTSEQPVTAETITDVVADICGFVATEFCGADKPLDDPTPIEELFYESMRVYNSYWRNDPVFDKRNTREATPHLPCPVVNREMLQRLSRVAIEMGFRWKEITPQTVATQK